MAKRNYPLYKGLQRPLVFKMFKGRFIYWALGSLLGGIVAGIIVGAAVSSLAGLISMVMISLPLLFFTISKQKKGLYEKKVDEASFIIQPQHRQVRKHESKTKI